MAPPQPVDTLAALRCQMRVCAPPVVQACKARDRQKEKRKKESQRLRRAHAGAMGAMGALQKLDETAGADALRVGIEAASVHVGALPGLEGEVRELA